MISNVALNVPIQRFQTSCLICLLSGVRFHKKRNTEPASLINSGLDFALLAVTTDTQQTQAQSQHVHGVDCTFLKSDTKIWKRSEAENEKNAQLNLAFG